LPGHLDQDKKGCCSREDGGRLEEERQVRPSAKRRPHSFVMERPPRRVAESSCE